MGRRHLYTRCDAEFLAANAPLCGLSRGIAIRSEVSSNRPVGARVLSGLGEGGRCLDWDSFS